MPSLQIRDLPDDVYEALAYRARRAGRSLAQQALAELREVSQAKRRQQRLAVLDEIERRRRVAPTAKWPAPEEMIRADRER